MRWGPALSDAGAARLPALLLANLLLVALALHLFLPALLLRFLVLALLAIAGLGRAQNSLIAPAGVAVPLWIA